MSKRTLLSNYALRFAVTLMERGVGLIVIPILVAEVGLNGVGSYGLSSSLILVFVNIVCLRFPMAMIRFLPPERSNAGAVLVTSFIFWLGFSAVSILVVALAPEFAAKLVFADPQKVVLVWLSLSVGLISTLYEFVSVPLRAENRFGLLSVVDVCERLAFLGASLLIFQLGHRTIEAVLGVMVGTSVLRLVVVAAPSLKGIRFQWPTLGLASTLFGFSLPFLPHLVSTWLVERSPFFIVAQRMDEAATGLLTVAFSFAAVLNAVVLPIQATLYPMLSRAYDEGRQHDVHELVRLALRIALIVGSFGTISFTIGTEHLLKLLGIEEAAPPMTLMLLMTLAFTASAVRQVIINVLHIRHDTRSLYWISPVGGIVAVAASAALVIPFGLPGAASGMLVGAVVHTAAMAIRIKNGALLILSSSFWLALVAASVTALVLQTAVGSLGTGFYVLGCAASGCVYLAVLFFCGGITAEEKNAILNRLGVRSSRVA